MEVYVLDGLLRRNYVIDKFESLIWTERWNESGDFELDLKSTLENRSQFLVGAHLAINNSHRVMTVETVEDNTTEDGKEVLRVTGRSLEYILEDRVAMPSLETQMWPLMDTPGNVARAMFDHICRPPAALDEKDQIPFLQPGEMYPPGTIPEPDTPIAWGQRPESLYEAIKTVCKLYDLGFRLTRNFDTSQLYFDVYSGNDRTTRQTDNSPVIFSVGLDNLQNTTEFNSVEKSKNVAYVHSDWGSAIIYGENVDPDVEGFDRRVIFVGVNVPEEHPNVGAVLQQEGEKALLDNRAKSIFEGEVNQRTIYTYGVDYELGDLVEMRNKDGVITYKRVTEQIFVGDEQGERAYPTLALDKFAGENTWLSWTNKLTVWEDFDEEFWADM